LISLVLAQCIVVIYAMSEPGHNNAMPAPDIPLDPYHVCVLFSDPRMDTAYLAVSIAFDSIVFAITLIFTVKEHRLRPNSILLQTIQRDGTLYFCVILTGNLTWMLLALYARPSLKFMNAQPSMILTSIMINRLTLSLRRASHDQNIAWGWQTFQWPEDLIGCPSIGHEMIIRVPTST